MSRRTFGMMAALIGVGVWSAGAAHAEPVEIPAPLERIFVPSGYDDNDNVELILQGTFRSSCYRVGRTGAKIDRQRKLILVHASAYKYAGGVDCAQVLTPFIQTIKLGIVPKGRYLVQFRNNTAVNEHLVVNGAASEEPDEEFYAPVEYADVVLDRETGAPQLTLHGNYPRMLIGCAQFQEIRILRQSSDLMVVLPILAVTEGSECVGQPLQFKRTISLDNFLDRGGLMHVRVLNGSSVNRFFTFEESRNIVAP